MTRQASVILDNPVTLPAPGAPKAPAPRLVSKSNAAAVEKKAVKELLKILNADRKALIKAHTQAIRSHAKELKKIDKDIAAQEKVLAKL